jgi:hypothetical protein
MKQELTDLYEAAKQAAIKKQQTAEQDALENLTRRYEEVYYALTPAFNGLLELKFTDNIGSPYLQIGGHRFSVTASSLDPLNVRFVMVPDICPTLKVSDLASFGRYLIWFEQATKKCARVNSELSNIGK